MTDDLRIQLQEQARQAQFWRAEAWWDDDGYRNWRSNNEWNGARYA